MTIAKSTAIVIVSAVIVYVIMLLVKYVALRLLLGRPVRFRAKLSLVATFMIWIPWTIVLSMKTYVESIVDLPSANSQVVADIDTISSALEMFAQAYGDYPPDFSSGDPKAEIDEYLQTIFPDRDPELDIPPELSELGPHNAVWFWFRGFYPDPFRPLTGPTYGMEDRIRVVEEDVEEWQKRGYEIGAFTESDDIELGYLRMINDDAEREYFMIPAIRERQPLYEANSKVGRLISKGQRGIRIGRLNAPLVYFRSDRYELAKFEGKSSWGKATPYRDFGQESDLSGWKKPDSFQLVCAGSDDRYGTGVAIAPSQVLRFSDHADNLTNFSMTILACEPILEMRRVARHRLALGQLAAVICLLLYPLARALRHPADGMHVLRQSLRSQWLGASPSDRWAEILELQKSVRREQAIQRFRSPGTEN